MDFLLEKLHDLQVKNYIFIGIFISILILALISFRRLNQIEYHKIFEAEKLLQQEIDEKTEALRRFNEELQERVDQEVQINLKQKIQLQENLKHAR